MTRRTFPSAVQLVLNNLQRELRTSTEFLRNGVDAIIMNRTPANKESLETLSVRILGYIYTIVYILKLLKTIY